MSFPFELITSTTSIIAGLSSVISTVFIYLKNKRDQKNKIAKTKEEEFENVLSSNEISTLGEYLDNNLGHFNIHEYTYSKEVEKKVDKYLEKIQEFVGTSEKINEKIQINNNITTSV